MNNYVIVTDLCSDISPARLTEWGVPYTGMTFHFTDTETEYAATDMELKAFYDKMRSGGVAKTSAINVDAFRELFEPLLKEGKDILYLAFSSGLSGTYNASRMAAEELLEKYPERKLLTVDTLCASAGQGLLVYLTLEQKKNGATLEEVAAYAEKTKWNICHWFTVDDLVYLKRGGRISPTLAFVGNALGLKPVLHVDNEGHLVNVAKIRGRKASLSTMADKYGEMAEDTAKGTVFISHGDSIEDANALAAQLKSRYGVDVALITDIGSVIGAHSGPGTIALFFVGKER